MKKILLPLLISGLLGCSKNLELKPDSSLIVPTTAQDLENLLDNTDNVMNLTPALAQLSADEYFIVDLASWQSLINVVPRATYIWDKEIFPGQTQVNDWKLTYQAIFYCNSVLDELAKQKIDNSPALKNIKGWALFTRAYMCYTLASIYAKAYDPATANTDLGIPLKLNSAITEIVQRSSVEETYQQIIKDVMDAKNLLIQDITPDKKNRPSKVAAYALLARVYLSMRKYELAESNADQALALYSQLTDFNALAISTRSSFTINAQETIYFTQQLGEYQTTIYSNNTVYGVDSTLIKLYDPNDLRPSVYFRVNAIGNYIPSKGINNDRGNPFTGLATDELYLIKAECLARRQQKDDALSFLNKLLKTRMKTGRFVAITAANADDALEKVLIERRKALVWRSVRWTDLKRFNLEGRNIKLTRNLSGQVYTLNPNSPRYVLPIPDDEIALSGLQQNIR